MENDKLYDCAESYLQSSGYEYKIKLFSSGKISEATFLFNRSHFMHLSGLEKLNDIVSSSDISSEELLNKILNRNITYPNISESNFWGEVFNDPQKNNVTYTLDDRIDTLTNFRNILNNSHIKAYSWDSKCHRTNRPYSSEIAADFMLVFETANKKTPDERIYAFFKLDKNNPEIAHGMSQFPTDRTYNNDGRRSVPEITIMSLIEHDKVNDTYRVITELHAEEQQRLVEKSLKNSEYTTIKADLKQLKSIRTKYYESNTESTQKAYVKKMSVFSNTNIYTPEMLNEVIERLNTQMNDIHNSDVAPYIKREIDFITSELERRKTSELCESNIGSFTIKFNQLNNNGTILATPAAEVPMPKIIDKIHSKAEREAHKAISGIRSLLYDIKDTFKNLFTKNSDRSQEKADSEAPKKTSDSLDIYTTPYSLDFQLPLKQHSKFDELIEAREAFAEDKITMTEYKQAIGNYMRSLNSKEMWTEAANNLRKQLEECPDNMKKCIDFELSSIELNIKRKFPQKQTLDEIKSAAHEQYVKLQTENKAAEKEITTVKSKSER